ncbi:MAG: glycosyltransferase family 4 protein [Paraprevotella sp.]|nr:glycosyltransferase family 4 protein [Paraprevotella sp.]
MRVLIVNTSENIGGAAIAANRLMEALKNNGVKAKMLVRDKRTEQITVASLPQSPMLKAKFAWERFCIWKANRFSKHNLFQVDLANTGTDITSLPEFKEADVIHLHWVNQGFLSLKDIRRFIETGKPIVWTMHDQWPFTGICHYSGTCTKYRTECHHCPMLAGGGSSHDLSAKVFRRKQNMLHGAHIIFVACSRWLEGLARQSSLLVGQEVTSIPNTINTNVFHPMEHMQMRLQCDLPIDKKLLLFGSLKATDPRKGIDYLVEACRLLKEKHAELAAQIGIVVVGNRADQIRSLFPFPVYAIDYVGNEKQMARLYNTADAYVTPSLEDNLPNTIVEALSCGIPCVGFNVGGIPEMIEHRKNGYLAEACNAEDLAEGIRFVLEAPAPEDLSAQAVHSALAKYGENNIASKYIAVYRRASDKT